MPEHEIDMDCEFGMDHIQKFRLDRVREDNLFIDNYNGELGNVPPNPNPIDIFPLGMFNL